MLHAGEPSAPGHRLLTALPLAQSLRARSESLQAPSATCVLFLVFVVLFFFLRVFLFFCVCVCVFLFIQFCVFVLFSLPGLDSSSLAPPSYCFFEQSTQEVDWSKPLSEWIGPKTSPNFLVATQIMFQKV